MNIDSVPDKCKKPSELVFKMKCKSVAEAKQFKGNINDMMKFYGESHTRYSVVVYHNGKKVRA